MDLLRHELFVYKCFDFSWKRTFLKNSNCEYTFFFSEKAEFVNKIELAESNSVSTAQFEAPNTKKSAQKGKPTE